MTSKNNNKIISSVNILVLFVTAAFVLVSAAMHVPGYLAYRKKLKREKAFASIVPIHKSFKSFAENKPYPLFPSQVDNYSDLSRIVNRQGHFLPERMSDTKIDSFHYETKDRKSYLLRIDVKGNEHYFFILLPEIIVEVHKVDSIDDQPIMDLIRRLLEAGYASVEELDGGGYLESKARKDAFEYSWAGCRTDRYRENCVRLLISRKDSEEK